MKGGICVKLLTQVLEPIGQPRIIYKKLQSCFVSRSGFEYEFIRWLTLLLKPAKKHNPTSTRVAAQLRIFGSYIPKIIG